LSTSGGLASPVPLDQNAPDLGPRVLTAHHIALLLDFDGTISEIVPRPEDAEIAPQIWPTLKALAARPDFNVAVVSGRGLTDLRARTGLENVIYVGNHGLEIEAGATRFREPHAESLRRELRSLSLQLKLALAETDGLEIEDKGLTLSVHYRRVPEQLHHWVRTVTNGAAARSRSFESREGKMVLDIKPQINWNKGYAVKWILREVLPSSALPIYIGDDVTDEDAFAAIPEGITIRVGEPGDSRAQYHLPNVAAVGEFLQWLAQAKSHGSLATSQRAGR
jgi:trehalose 6-phosphate phosphatase